jgi:hypothetical protein
MLIFSKSFIKFTGKILTHKKIYYSFIMENSKDEKRNQDLQDMAHKLRIHAIEMTDASGSG